MPIPRSGWRPLSGEPPARRGRAATLRLAEAGVASPRADAEELAAFVHGIRRGELHTVADSDFDARYWECVARRAAREPLQHITGRAYFRYLELEVGPGVFIPRPETEMMVSWAIDTLRAMDVADPLVVDLGTGSGAIAISIAQEVPRSRVHAVEIDATALSWAERNIARSGLGERIAAHHADMRTCLPEYNGGWTWSSLTPRMCRSTVLTRFPQRSATTIPL